MFQYGSHRAGQLADRGHGFAAPRGIAPRARRYTVRPGDTLSAIAARAYGSTAGWPRCGGPAAARSPTRT